MAFDIHQDHKVTAVLRAVGSVCAPGGSQSNSAHAELRTAYRSYLADYPDPWHPDGHPADKPPLAQPTRADLTEVGAAFEELDGLERMGELLLRDGAEATVVAVLPHHRLKVDPLVAHDMVETRMRELRRRLRRLGMKL